VTVPVAGEEVLAWGTPKVDTETTVLDGHTFAILRMAPATQGDSSMHPAQIAARGIVQVSHRCAVPYC
jgi:hypothetical protein